MLIWGGSTQRDNEWSTLETGARYNPKDERWTPLAVLNNPSERSYHTAVWTGSEMIIWGGAANDDHDRTSTVFG